MRLLATVYFEWDCQKFHDKALDAVTLANKVRYETVSFSLCNLHMRFDTNTKIHLRYSVPSNTAILQECMNASGQYLKMRILLGCKAPDDHIRAG